MVTLPTTLQGVFLCCAMAALKTEQQMSLKLVLNPEKSWVLYAESGTYFIDTLFSFLTPPFGNHCKTCEQGLTAKEQYLGGEGHGFSNGKMTFIITDYLRIIPNSLVASLNLLEDFGIDDICSVHNMTITVTKDKGLNILKASLITGLALTNGFSHLFSVQEEK
ncbi:DUF674 family protein [Arachis hypogaea]|nr:DUF674 family protein [Arachis hypogaea]